MRVWVLIQVHSKMMMIVLVWISKKPIPMVQYRDSYTWVKYCPRFIKLDFYGEGQIKKKLHGSFRSSMIEFLQTDIAGTPSCSMNPNILGEVQQFLLYLFLDLNLDKQH